MKKLISLLLLAISISTFGQSVPTGINYQAVIRNSDGTGLKNRTVGVKIVIFKGLVSDLSPVANYTEVFTLSTNDVGLINLLIGKGTPVTGSFSSINWSTGNYFVALYADIAGGTAYTYVGSQQLMSVPYAMFAEKSKNLLVLSSSLPAGASCSSGGTKLEFGIDANMNGLLDATEIDALLTKNVCNGATGAAGTKILNGTANPISTQGVVGDYYFNSTTKTLFGPKVSTGWPTGISLTGAQGTPGVNGSVIISGTSTPLASQGVNGDYYFNTTTKVMFGPKVNGAWPTSGVSLVGSTGAAGLNGSTILNGASNPTSTQGVNGDYFLNTATKTLFGPKASGLWPSTGLSLVGTTGATGAAGKSILTGTSAPASTVGNIGDIYLNTATNLLYGPKTTTGWPTISTSLVGPTGKSMLTGTINPASTVGNNGDVYLNTSTKVLYGPKANGIWPSTGTLLDTQTDYSLYSSPRNASAQYPTGGTQLMLYKAGPGGTDTLSIDGGFSPYNTLTKTTTIPSGTTCRLGGTLIETGIDSNRNGILDQNEVQTSQIICNSFSEVTKISSPVPPSTSYPNGGNQVMMVYKSPGPGGTDTLTIDGGTTAHMTLTKTTTIPSGTTCRLGGTKIETGVDLNDNGILEASEVQNTQIICNSFSEVTKISSPVPPSTSYPNGGNQVMMVYKSPGPGGTDTLTIDGGTTAHMTLTKTTTIPSGTTCRLGGTKIETGVDLNDNGILEASEVQNTQIICNSFSEVTKISSPVPASPQLPNGGTQMLMVYRSPGPGGTDTLTVDGGTIAHMTLTKTTTIASGTTCRLGGTKIETGIDLNDNGVLEASEVQNTQIICNSFTQVTKISSPIPVSNDYPNGATQVMMVYKSPGPGGTDTLTVDGGTTAYTTLTKTSSIPPGTTCIYGGTKIETGVDSNRNGVLDSSEVDPTKTQIICNTNTKTASYTTPGTYIWTCPEGIQSVLVKAQGAGGAGGNGSNMLCSNSYMTACSGAGGGYAEAVFTVTPGQQYRIVVGTGGTTINKTGGNSIFQDNNTNAKVIALGGNGGFDAYGNCETNRTVSIGGIVEYSNCSLILSQNGSNGRYYNTAYTSYNSFEGGKSKALNLPRRIAENDSNEFGQGGHSGISGQQPIQGENGAEGFVIIEY